MDKKKEEQKVEKEKFLLDKEQRHAEFLKYKQEEMKRIMEMKNRKKNELMEEVKKREMSKVCTIFLSFSKSNLA